MGVTKKISYEERLRIEALLKKGIASFTISKMLGRSQSVIQREIMRCGGYNGYNAKDAENKTGIKVSSLFETANKSATPSIRKVATRISYEERKLIEDGLKRNFSAIKISTRIGRSDTTIHYEIRRNGGRRVYNAFKAQKRAESLGKYAVSEIEDYEEIEKEEDKSLNTRLDSVEMQIEILFDIIKGLKDGSTKNN